MKLKNRISMLVSVFFWNLLSRLKSIALQKLLENNSNITFDVMKLFKYINMNNKFLRVKKSENINLRKTSILKDAIKKNRFVYLDFADESTNNNIKTT